MSRVSLYLLRPPRKERNQLAVKVDTRKAVALFAARFMHRANPSLLIGWTPTGKASD
jgi:hypothetical protein